jgi:hypothetical protein
MEENARVIFATGLRRHLRIQPSLSIGALPANPGGERLACIEQRVLTFLACYCVTAGQSGKGWLDFSGNCIKHFVFLLADIKPFLEEMTVAK